MPKIVHSYWPIRGLGQPVRLMLEYVGEEWEDKHQAGPDAWGAEKNTLGLDFPNLPYIIDGEVKLSQTMAILRYLGNKHNMAPQSLEENARADLAAEQFLDFRNAFVQLVYYTWDTMEGSYNESLPGKLAAFDAFLGSREWMAGGKQPTFVDFYAYEILDHNRRYKPEMFEPNKNLVGYMKRFEELPKIKSYMASDRFMKDPINAPSAKWGNK